jgi:O-antigen ligase/tetratricopeptide (TPR) repeat protein
MTGKLSIVFTVLLIIVMLGVIFGVLTDSRSSILIKEIIYVAGGSLASFIAAVFLFMGKPCYRHRIPRISLLSVSAVLILNVIMHFAGVGSVNGYFTFFMLLSLAALAVSSLLFISEKHFRVFVLFLVGSSALLFIYSIIQWQGINLFPWDAALTRSGRSSGSLGNPNLLGGYASAIIPLGFAFLLSLKKLKGTIRSTLAAMFACLALLSIVSSGTRGSIIGVVSGCGFFLVWYMKTSGKPLKKLLPVMVLFLAGIGFVTLPMASRLSELGNSSGEEQGTFQVRKLIWAGAFEAFTDSPLVGHGPGSFQIIYPTYRNPSYSLLGVSHNTLHAHCEYLEILVDLGLLGLILWGGFLWGLKSRLAGAGILHAGAFASIVAMLTEALVSVHLRWPPTAWLFATLVTVFLSAGAKPAQACKKRILAAVGFTLVSVVLGLGVFVHYLPSSRSAELVFRGKDVFLTKAEMAMNSAYTAAAEWMISKDQASLNAVAVSWQNASMYADSAVICSRQATEIYPKDMGAWYALGSAYLTRYMIMDPPVQALISALEVSGSATEYTDQQKTDEIQRGMAAYNNLSTMAPNYAEIHNNLALGYSNLGMLKEAMDELYKAYILHAHRRDDYFSQVSALLPLYPSSESGVLLYFHQMLTVSAEDLTGIKEEVLNRGLTDAVWYIFAVQPQNADSLERVFLNLCRENISEEQQVAISEIIQNAENNSPFASWESGAIFQMSFEEALTQFKTMTVSARFRGSVFPTALPAESEFYRYPADVLFASNWDGEIFGRVMDIFLNEIVIDRNLDNTYLLFSSRRFGATADSVAGARLTDVRFAVGGSRAAMREGYPMPWMEGSLPAVISDSLHIMMASDSLNTDLYAMELRMTFLLVTSYWWDYNIFVYTQNQYLLERIFFCRDKIRELEPDSWQLIVSGILDDEISRIVLLTPCPPTITLLRNDLVNGASRIME